ncbi:MAG: lipid export permease/ATP-binding protein MsbA [Pseudomonadota bacterium]
MTSQPRIRYRLRRAFSHFTQPISAWVISLLCVVLVSASEPLIPALLKPLLDKGFAQTDFPVWQVPIALIGLFGLRGIGVFLSQVAVAKATNQGLVKLRLQMFARMQNADLVLFKNQSASALGNTLVFEVQNGALLMVSSVMSLVRDGLTLIALVAYLLYLNWQLSLIVALLFPAVAWLMKVMSKRLYQITRDTQTATDELAYVVEENALAYREIRLHQAQSMQVGRFQKLAQKLQRLAMKTAIASSGITPMTQILSAIALSGVISVALLQSHQTGMTVGGFAAFVTAMLMLVAPIKHLSEITGPLTRGLAALERGFELIENTPTETGGSYTSEKARGQIVFEDISVRYQDDLPWALQHINLKIEPGETVALVGSSGSGKTTLANVLIRFVEATQGKARLDGVAVQDWNLLSLRQQFALVSQNVVVLNDSLAANVALGQTPDEQRVVACLKAAHLSDYLATLPQHIHTLVGHNASTMSGGQRQRLAIARALYKDAPVLILDEATSALDNESERLVQDALQSLQKNRTTLVIAHRLTTIEKADRIIVMEHGRIVEQGTHQQLLQAQGAYAAMFKLSQSTGVAPSQ